MEYEISWWKTVWHDDCSYLWLYIFPLQFGELLIEAYLSSAVCLDKEMFITACKESHSNNKAGLTEDFIEAVKVEESCQGLEEFFSLYRGIVVWWVLSPPPHWASILETTERNILKAKVGWNKDRSEDVIETGKFSNNFISVCLLDADCDWS